MTFSNGRYNPNPLANPFNTRLGPANYSLNPSSSSFKPTFNIKNTQLPNPRAYDPDLALQSKDLVPPNQLDYSQETSTARTAVGQFITKSLYAMSDGTIVNFDTGNVLKRPLDHGEYWNDPDLTIQSHSEEVCWNDVDEIGNLYPLDYMTDKRSSDYWNNAEQKSSELYDNLTDEQKELLKDLEDGKIFSLSKLELDDNS